MRSRLTPLQQELLAAFFKRERRFFLTGGGALVGFYFGHRETEDLDFFSAPGPELVEVARTVAGIAAELGAKSEVRSAHRDFHRTVVTRGPEECVVDLVIDRAPFIEAEKPTVGDVRLDSKREIAANKICAVIGRSELKDLVDLRVLLESGIALHQAFEDAQKKEGSADPATLAWVIDQIVISPSSRLPSGVDPADLNRFKDDFVKRLRSEAFALAKGKLGSGDRALRSRTDTDEDPI